MQDRFNRRELSGLLDANVLVLAWPARAFADYSIRVYSTSQPGPSDCFVANDTGIFERNGIKFEHVIICLNPNVPPAVISAP